MRLVILAGLLLIAQAHAARIPARGTYSPPIGDFKCRDYPFDVDVDEALGPHGGTIRLRDGMREIRIDLEEFNPVLDKGTLAANRVALYEGYLANNTLPLLRRVSPDAELLEARFLVLEKPHMNLPVYQSAVLMSKGEGVRGQIQYSDGRFMYTISHFARVEKNASREIQLHAAYEELLIGLSWCHFPDLERRT